jgi:hypothetical protein
MKRAAIICVTLAAALAAQEPAQKIWTGIYTEEQAGRGQEHFAKSCSNCHNADLNGNDRGPALKGDRFLGNWLNGSVGSLFSKIRFFMPATYPETVPDGDKIEILSFLLKVNGFPSGAGVLPLDQEELDKIPIVRQGQTGLANFTLVSVVGCLERGQGNTWMLSRTTDPAAVNTDAPDAASLAASASRALGEQRYRLVSVGAFTPESHRGQKVEARGLYYHEPGENRLNLTGLATTGTSCAAN